jgi:phosphopantothenoylcysteine decarboxylase/phosphopantothenate--cysteine ligase
VRRVDVRSAQEMHDAVLAECKTADVLVMAAAVADFRPAKIAGQKIKKGGGIPEIRLENTVDILGRVAEERGKVNSLRAVIGFAAESQDLLENARAKLLNKQLDVIVANDIRAEDAGFEADTNRVSLLYADGRVETLPLLDKQAVAGRVMDVVVQLLG